MEVDEQEITIDLRDLWNVLKKNIRTIKKGNLWLRGCCSSISDCCASYL